LFVRFGRMHISLEGLMHDPMLLLKPPRQNGLTGDYAGLCFCFDGGHLSPRHFYRPIFCGRGYEEVARNL